MSTQSSPEKTEAVVAQSYQQQQLNIYTVMLIIAFICISIAVLLLYLELQRWGEYPWWNTRGAGTTTSMLLESPLETARTYLRV